MFDRFSENAKQVMMASRQAALDLDAECIDTEHVLLGLLRVERCVAVIALEKLGFDVGRVIEDVKNRAPRGAYPQTTDSLPFTPSAKKILELAMEQSSQAGHTYIGTEHLLVGCIRTGRGIGWQVLHEDLDIEWQAVWTACKDANAAEPAQEQLAALPARSKDPVDHAIIVAARALIAQRYIEGKHQIASALRTKSGDLHVGVHLEATCGRIAVCGEAIAIGAAATNGDTDIAQIVAVTEGGDIVPPCGMCRELVSDYASDALVVLEGADGPYCVPVLDLLPNKYERG